MNFSNYSDAELMALQQQLQNQPQMSLPNSAPTLFQQDYYDNLIKWQLDIKEELERIEHLLRKHIPKIDSKGNVFYEEPKDEDRLFNETGVNEILNLLAWYLNKNIILSNFSEEAINLRCLQFTIFLSDFIFNNYQRFGLDTDDKIKHYPLVVMNIANTVEASYNRALNGGERESLRTARTVQQHEPLMNGMNQMGGMGMGMMAGMGQKKFSVFKPWTWGR